MNQIEKAKISDVTKIHKLINSYADKGLMLPRPLSEIYESIRDFFVIRDDGGEVVACAALHVSWENLAEIRSVAVAEEKHKMGMGAQLIGACLKEAEELGIETIFCFTYQPEFFKRQKFEDVDKMELPRKVWSDCLRCPKFPNCDEISLIYHAEKKS